jgi:hypothetical protein
MAHHTKPAFIVGSGRSGTRAIFKLFSGIPDVEIHHEYCCTHIQPPATQYFMGVIDKPAVMCAIQKVHGAAIYHTPAGTWIDSSTWLSWVIEPLLELFPNCRFVHITRDGRKVAGSFFNKIGHEVYHPASVATLMRWLKDRSLSTPPPEKRFWWYVPQPGQPFHEEFPTFNQFQRICYHWHETMRVIDESFRRIPSDRHMTVKLEDLTTSRKTVGEFTDFLGIEYQERFYQALQRPEHVIVPQDAQLTPEQIEQFSAITGDTMERLGYDINTKMYELKYDDPLQPARPNGRMVSWGSIVFARHFRPKRRPAASFTSGRI